MRRGSIWVAGVATCLLALALAYNQHLVWGLVLFVGSLFIVSVGEVWLDRKQRKKWFASHFSTPEELRDAVDVDSLRTLRDEKSVPAAVLKVRRQFPKIPLAEANRLIKNL